ncbi:hypothetical protein COCMIDRAFT_8013 [Bipolaris oryzae ATCC 44560]|uniref:FAD/NAD(P)-binding domain-containing protein n=1 Tax=Bipolaris oryzae ATCC 44560 TaxID=930090 RepID=W6YSK0_COCMI|nr:uncharacterized protein COCMIDRAFT_8013 [Bipolaris oryzae ATCC 44560]EUC42427.1 hypothetical protein COCMIDRAFT_8013 [Bipolaris oryzae ATCC 44560]
MVSPQISPFLHDKYQAERDKRLNRNQDGLEQFVSFDKEPKLDSDPWIDHETVAANQPLAEGSEVKLLIVGGGHSGLLTAVRVIEEGFDSKDVVIVDKAGGFGGTWYWNRYLGVGCDIESYCYMPLLEEIGYVPKHKYAYGTEIREHAARIAKKWNIQAQFGTTVAGMSWDETTRRWVVSILRNHKDGRTTRLQVKAQFVMLSFGIFPIPRWDYELTGGTQEQPDMSKLKDKVVGIVGTGATAAERRSNFNANLCFEGAEIDLVNDGWTRSTSFFGLLGSASKTITQDNFEEHRQEMLKLDLEIGEKGRAYIANEVHDPVTATKLLLWYYGWCKRPTFYDDYLSVFNWNNVTLVDLDGKGLEKCTPFGPVANGAPYNLDVLVFATGFFTGVSGAPGAYWPFSIIGRYGKSLETKFRSKEFAILHGIMISEFPNLFVISPRGSPGTANLTLTFDVAAKHIAYILRTAFGKVENSNKLVVEPSKAAEEGWGGEVARRAGWYSLAGLCTPGYMTGHDDAMKKITPDEARSQARAAPFGGGVNGYQRILDNYHQSGGLPGIVVST